MEDNKSNTKIWTRIAQIAGAFAFIISILLIVNYVQYKSIDPVETELINELIIRLNHNPNDNPLRDQIRALDLLSRKAYFTNQWQVRTGGYLLLISIGFLVIAMQIIKANANKTVIISDKGNSFIEQKNARKWITIGGVIIVLTALVFAFLTHNELEKIPILNNTDLNSQNIAADKENIEIIAEQPLLTNNNDQNEITTSETVDKTALETDSTIVENPEKLVVSLDNETQKSPKDNVPLNNPSTKKEQKKEPTPEKTHTLFPSDQDIKNNHPSFRGPGGNGISFHKNIPVVWDGATGKNILWKIKTPLHGYNSPIIWDDKVFVSGATADKREVYCIDGNTGKFLWTYDVSNIPGSPAKSPKVTDDTGLAAPTLTTDGKRVYAIFGNGDLIAINMDGVKVWARNLGDPGNHYGHSSSLLLFQDILILQYDSKKSPKIMGLNSSTGETIWSTDRNVRVSWASPIVVNTGSETEVIIASDPIVASYNPINGKENWQIDCIFGEVGPSVAYTDGIVFAVNEYAKLVAIKIGDPPEIIWENDEYLSDVPSPVATNGLLFMATSYGAIVCYDAKTGEKYWENEYDNGFYSSPVIAEDKVYLMDMEGIMHIFKAAKEFELVAESPLGEKGMTTPAFSDGKIYVRGNEHLFCISN